MARAKTDPYAMLGVPPSATAAEIRRAYRTQIVVTHRSGVLGVVDDLHELRLAYETLRDPERRRAHDARASAPPLPDDGTRERREGRVLQEVRRDVARHSVRVSVAARAENADRVRNLGVEHDRRASEENAAHARRRRLGRLVGVLLWVLLAAAAVSAFALTRGG